MNDTNELASSRIDKALERIEAAQGLLRDASEALCSVRGAAEEWRDIVNTYDAVKLLWHRVNDATENRKRFTLAPRF